MSASEAGATSGNSAPSRRTILKAAGIGGLAITGMGVTACAAAVFNPAVDSWLADLASAIGASVISDIASTGLKDAWAGWQGGVKRHVDDQSYYWYLDGYVHPRPPVALVGLTKSKTIDDPTTDRLMACVNGGQASILFKPWAWQTLASYVNDQTVGKSGDDLANAQNLCVLGVIPSDTRPKTGSSPENTVGWMTYATRLGWVEIAYAQQSDSSWNGILTASGIVDVNGNPVTKSYPLPS